MKLLKRHEARYIKRRLHIGSGQMKMTMGRSYIFEYEDRLIIEKQPELSSLSDVRKERKEFELIQPTVGKRTMTIPTQNGGAIDTTMYHTLIWEL